MSGIGGRAGYSASALQLTPDCRKRAPPIYAGVFLQNGRNRGARGTFEAERRAASPRRQESIASEPPSRLARAAMLTSPWPPSISSASKPLPLSAIARCRQPPSNRSRIFTSVQPEWRAMVCRLSLKIRKTCQADVRADHRIRLRGGRLKAELGAVVAEEVAREPAHAVRQIVQPVLFRVYCPHDVAHRIDQLAREVGDVG